MHGEIDLQLLWTGHDFPPRPPTYHNVQTATDTCGPLASHSAAWDGSRWRKSPEADRMLSVTRRAKQAAAQLWPPIAAQLTSRIALGRLWPRAKELSLDAWKRSAPAREWMSHHPNLVIAPAIVVPILFLLRAGQVAVAATLIGAWFALARGISQAAADFRRRINETYSRAVSQLASDKLEERLGGIYTLENISKESPQDHWTVMENLTVFVRERTRRTERRIAECAYSLWEKAGQPDGRSQQFWDKAVEQETQGSQPAPDVAAVLTVISRRSEDHRALERRDAKVLDLRRAVLRGDLSTWRLEGVNLSGAHLEGASLQHAHLEGVNLSGAHLEGANLRHAHLDGADLSGAHLEGAWLDGAHLKRVSFVELHLEGAHLRGAHLDGADLSRAHLDGADLIYAHLEHAILEYTHLERAYLIGAHLDGAYLRCAFLEGSHLSGAEGLTQAQIGAAFGDAAIPLPAGLTRPAHWSRSRDEQIEHLTS